jgi:hypothetical protein
MIRSDKGSTIVHPESLSMLSGIVLYVVLGTTHVLAQASPSPSASRVPASSAPSDPCGSIISIVTRPTITTSTCNVRPGHALLENGYANTVSTGSGGGITASFPQEFLRIGVTQHVEIAITPPSFERTSAGGPLVSGFTDTNVGAKWEMGYTSKAVWGMSAQLSFPSGSPAFTAGESQYVFNGNWGYTVNPLFAMAGTVGLNALAGTGPTGAISRFGAVAPSVVFELTPTSTTEVFAEYAYISKAGVDLPGKTTLDVGLIGDVGTGVQLDVEAGWSPTLINGQRQHYIGAGISFMN